MILIFCDFYIRVIIPLFRRVFILHFFSTLLRIFHYKLICRFIPRLSESSSPSVSKHLILPYCILFSPTFLSKILSTLFSLFSPILLFQPLYPFPLLLSSPPFSLFLFSPHIALLPFSLLFSIFSISL